MNNEEYEYLSDVIYKEKLSEKAVADIGINLCKQIKTLCSLKDEYISIYPEKIILYEDSCYLYEYLTECKVLHPESVKATDSIENSYFFMAPEVYIAEGLDESSYVYSVALIMYCCLGPPPFTDRDSDLLEKKKANVLRLSGEDIPELICSEGMSRVLNKGLAFEKSLRYQFLDELESELHQIGYDEKILMESNEDICAASSKEPYAEKTEKVSPYCAIKIIMSVLIMILGAESVLNMGSGDSYKTSSVPKVKEYQTVEIASIWENETIIGKLENSKMIKSDVYEKPKESPATNISAGHEKTAEKQSENKGKNIGENKDENKGNNKGENKDKNTDDTKAEDKVNHASVDAANKYAGEKTEMQNAADEELFFKNTIADLLGDKETEELKLYAKSYTGETGFNEEKSIRYWVGNFHIDSMSIEEAGRITECISNDIPCMNNGYGLHVSSKEDRDYGYELRIVISYR